MGEAAEGRFFVFLHFCFDFGPQMGSQRTGRGSRRFLKAVGFILAKFEPKQNRGDPIRDNFYGFWTRELAQLCLRERDLRLRETHLCLRERYVYMEYKYRIYVWHIYFTYMEYIK